MEPLQSVLMPTHGVVVGINAENSWQSGSAERPVRLAYIATNSTERLSFLGLHAGGDVLKLVSRPAKFEDMPYGVVIELHLAQELAEGEEVQLSLAQAGATTYYPPQQIDDVQG